MDDVEFYIQKRAASDPEFAQEFDTGYSDFKIGVILRQAREAAGLTQDEMARILNTKKPSLSRIENHATDVRLSTIQRHAEAMGAKVQIRLSNSPRA